MQFHLKMAGTSCTDDARVKVPSFQKVAVFSTILDIPHKRHPFCILVYVKMFLTAVIKDKQASNDSLESDSSFLFRNRMMTNTTSS